MIRYSYLWSHQSDLGAEEGRKDRPCAVVLAVSRAGGLTEVVVAPITSRAPAQAADATELPTETRRRLGLQAEPCWVMLTEVNRFAWPGPDLRPVDSTAGRSWTYGELPEVLFNLVRRAIAARARRGALRAISRPD